MSRLFDLLALLIVALVVLLPQPSIQAAPAVEGDQADLDRLAALEDAHSQRPGDVQVAVELGRAYLQVDQPAWALAVLPLGAGAPYEAHQVAAFAYATLLRPADALREAEAGLAACERGGCSETARIRLSYLAELMRKPVAAGVDPKKDPLAAKRAVSEALHATRVPERTAPAAPTAPATPPTPGAPQPKPAPKAP